MFSTLHGLGFPLYIAVLCISWRRPLSQILVLMHSTDYVAKEFSWYSIFHLFNHPLGRKTSRVFRGSVVANDLKQVQGTRIFNICNPQLLPYEALLNRSLVRYVI
jgi:hypothetical protein